MTINNLMDNDLGNKIYKKAITGLKENNPLIDYRTFSMEDIEDKDIHKKLDELYEKIDSINRKLEVIFGNYIILNGKFTDISNKDRK